MATKSAMALATAVVLCLYITKVSSEAKIENFKTSSNNNSIENWEIPEETMKKFPAYLSGFDYEHRRVYILNYGKWNLRKAVEARGEELENAERHTQKLFYRLAHDGKKYAQANETHSEEAVIIIDWDNFQYRQIASGATVQFFLRNMGKFQAIQSSIKYGYFINVNAVSTALINLSRPFMGAVLERIEMFGTQKSKWMPQLLKNIPKDQLPIEYGGSRDHKIVEFMG